MACGPERPPGVRCGSPEELEELLEDCIVIGDRAAIASLFEPAAVMVNRVGGHARGPLAIAESVLRLAYCAQPHTIVQARDVALVLSPQAINVTRRSPGGGWRFAVSYLDG